MLYISNAQLFASMEPAFHCRNTGYPSLSKQRIMKLEGHVACMERRYTLYLGCKYWEETVWVNHALNWMILKLILIRRAVSPLKIKIPSKNIRDKPTNGTIIYSVY
jgi:hypothetical protein